jgi:hypothetical protein
VCSSDLQTQHAGQVTLTITSTYGEQHKARRAYLRIAGFLARLRQTAERLDSGATLVSHPQRSAETLPQGAPTRPAALPCAGLSCSQGL